jgi:hypothetical protein
MNELPISLPDLPGAKFDENAPENMELPDGDRNEMFDLYAMQTQSQFATITKLYNMQQKMKLSKKRFPFPLKIYFDKTKKYFLMGCDKKEDFPDRQMVQDSTNGKMFIPFYLMCKLMNEEKWCSIYIESEEKCIFKFSNGIEKKYGY